MNDIVKSPNVIQSMDDVERAAKAMSASGFFPDSKSAAQAVVKVLAGRELGFGAFASMTGVAVIQGKPVIGANLLAAAVKQTGKYNYRVTEHTSEVCRIKFLEGNQEVGTSSFTMDDAKAAGLATKDNWKKYPRNMLFARAIANGQKWYAPDVFNGVTVYTPDEMGASVDDDGNIIEAPFKEVISVDTENQDLVIESAQPAPQKKFDLKPNEIINQAEWDKFCKLVADAIIKGIALPEYHREKMTAKTLNGATQYILNKMKEGK